MSAADDMEFISELGCRVRIVPGPDNLDPRGAMLVLQMEDIEDGRMASLYLSPENTKDLEYMLRRWSSELADKWAEEHRGVVEG